MSQQPKTPAAKRAIEDAITPSPSPSLRQPAKKKNTYNIPKGGTHGGQRKQAPVDMFKPIEFNKPDGTFASPMSTSSPIVAPKKATSRVSAFHLTDVQRPHTDFSQATVEDAENTEDSVPEVEPAVGLGNTKLESDVELMATRITCATTALKNAGFNSIATFLDAVCTTSFPARTTCAEIQREAWEDGIPRTLTLLSRHIDATKKSAYKLTPYRNAITQAAEAEYEREFLAFSKRKDRRQLDSVTGKKVGGYDLSILHKRACDVNGDWLGTNVMRDTQKEFAQKVSVYAQLHCII